MTHKEKAIELMKQIDIYKPYIDGFEKEDKVCVYENFGGFWVYQYPELQEKLNNIENKYGCKVYAVTHEYTEFGELYSFLIVPKIKRDWHDLIESNGDKHIAFAYVWNKTDD